MRTELILDSLQRRMAAMHSLWYQAASDMDTDQITHVEREAFCPLHFRCFT